MLRVIHDTDNIEVRFDHKFCRPHEIENLTGIFVDEDRRCSLVSIILNDGSARRGMAVCHPGDNFCKSTGRKKALADALCGFSKELRTAVWEEYEAQCGF